MESKLKEQPKREETENTQIYKEPRSETDTRHSDNLVMPEQLKDKNNCMSESDTTLGISLHTDCNQLFVGIINSLLGKQVPYSNHPVSLSVCVSSFPSTNLFQGDNFRLVSVDRSIVFKLHIYFTYHSEKTTIDFGGKKVNGQSHRSALFTNLILYL